MSSKTKIVVLRMKELIYTAIFIGLAILLVALFIIMFKPGKQTAETASDSLSFVPGVYSASLVLGSQNVNVEVAVDADHINGITLVSLSDSIATMYPLVQPALADLSEQICRTQSLENLSYSQETQYTSKALIQAIETALEKAQP